jgi:hypothetical protein
MCSSTQQIQRCIALIGHVGITLQLMLLLLSYAAGV